MSHGHAFLEEPLRRGSFAGALLGSCASQHIPRLCLLNMGEGFHFPLSALAALLCSGSVGQRLGLAHSPVQVAFT